MSEKVVVYRINDRTVSTPLKTYHGQQWVQGVPLYQVYKNAEWVNIFSNPKGNYRNA